MQVKFFYKSSSPESRLEDLSALSEEIRDFGAETEVIDVDSPDGSQQQELYDLTSLPAVVVAGPDGGVISEWKGDLPPAAEIRYWMGSA